MGSGGGDLLRCAGRALMLLARSDQQLYPTMQAGRGRRTDIINFAHIF
jgi:hypothetical protein